MLAHTCSAIAARIARSASRSAGSKAPAVGHHRQARHHERDVDVVLDEVRAPPPVVAERPDDGDQLLEVALVVEHLEAEAELEQRVVPAEEVVAGGQVEQRGGDGAEVPLAGPLQRRRELVARVAARRASAGERGLRPEQGRHARPSPARYFGLMCTFTVSVAVRP
jgi:hypothetical protein